MRFNEILNQITENESFGITFLKNCNLKTQKKKKMFFQIASDAFLITHNCKG